MLLISLMLGIWLFFLAFLLLAARLGTRDAERERALMIALNKGHEIWCEAGIEEKPRCVCKTVLRMCYPNDIDTRYATIRQEAARKGYQPSNPVKSSA